MQVVSTNATNELEMVYLEIRGAVIIADFLEIASNNEFNSLRHAISLWMQGSPSRFEVKMCEMLLQECTLLLKNKETCSVLLKNNT